MKNVNVKNITKGFTLIEALIVVVIVGLLAGVGIVKLGSAKDDAVTAISKTAASEINKGIQRAIIANDGVGYVAAFTPVVGAPADTTSASVNSIIDQLVIEGHLTAASATAMTQALVKADAAGHPLVPVAAVLAASTSLKTLAVAGLEVKVK